MGFSQSHPVTLTLVSKEELYDRLFLEVGHLQQREEDLDKLLERGSCYSKGWAKV